MTEGADGGGGRKIVIEPVTRVEGHGKVTIHLDAAGAVQEARLHIVEFRGFERFVQGRPYWEAPVLVQRLCGICPVSHHLAAAKAIDRIVGVGPDELSPAGEGMRRLMHYGQIFQSHALHFFYLAAPDLLFGVDADPAKRNVVGLLAEHRELALSGIRMRKLGQELIRATAGKRIHGISAVPGGIHKHLSEAERDFFFRGDEVPTPLQAADQLEALIDFIEDYHRRNRDWIDGFAAFPSNHLSLVGVGGAMDLYHGRLRAVAPDGRRLLDDVDYEGYLDHLGEEVRGWTWLKFPYLRALGPEAGWVRVGPLARLNVCDGIPTPRAQAALERYRAFAGERIVQRSLFYHWARLVEMLHCAEVIDGLLRDPALGSGELVRRGERRREGVGVIEAPRGTLLHHYEVDEHDAIRRCNLIVSTTHNNEAMNRAVREVAVQRLTGAVEITEGMLNEIEVAIRAYDPCLSCATHAVGQMPLRVSVHDDAGAELALRLKG